MADTFTERLQRLIDDARARAEGGLTWQEIGEIVQDGIQVAVAAADELTNPGAEKKELVLAFVGALFDVIAPAVPMPWWVSPFRPLIRPLLRAIVLQLASGAVEVILARLRAPKVTT